MTRWQYKVVVHKVLANQNVPDSYEDLERQATLNLYGRDGWELVSVVLQTYRRDSDSMNAYGYTYFSYYLKKPLDD